MIHFVLRSTLKSHTAKKNYFGYCFSSSWLLISWLHLHILRIVKQKKEFTDLGINNLLQCRQKYYATEPNTVACSSRGNLTPN